MCNHVWSLNVDNTTIYILILEFNKNRGQPLYQMSWKIMTIWPSSLQSTLKEHPSIKRRHLDFCLTATCGMCCKYIYSDWRRRRTSTHWQPLQWVTRHPWLPEPALKSQWTQTGFVSASLQHYMNEPRCRQAGSLLFMTSECLSQKCISLKSRSVHIPSETVGSLAL